MAKNHITLEESPRPDDEEGYWKKYWSQSVGHEIAGWWQKLPGMQPMDKLAKRINDAIAVSSGPDALVQSLFAVAGEDKTRPGLLETPARFLKAWLHYTSGYKIDPASVFKVFEDGAEGVDEMVRVQNIRVQSLCEHHLAPFFGVAHVAYIPNGKIVGLSKIARLVRVFMRRLQVQERLTNQIADCMENHLKPLGVGVVIKCRHLCMECRGVEEHNCVTTTAALRGVMKDKPEARSEFYSLIGK